MNNELHRSEQDAFERGYREALLDVYLFLTGDENALDLELERFNLIAAMADQVTACSSGKLAAIN
jgi:hypothetical protein